VQWLTAPIVERRGAPNTRSALLKRLVVRQLAGGPSLQVAPQLIYLRSGQASGTLFHRLSGERT
jgi:hypothetical protein